MLGDDAEFAAAARRGGGSIWDVRKPPDVPLFSGAAYDVRGAVVLTVGSDCAVGKMTAVARTHARRRRARARARGSSPTGQTGIMIAGWGIAIDRVIADFAPGAAEQLVARRRARARDLLFVEGQGGINHPAYAPVTLALLYGSAPDALVLVHLATRTADRRLRNAAARLSRADSHLRVALRGREARSRRRHRAQHATASTSSSARAAIAARASETRLPADDVVRFGPHALYAAIAPALATRRLRCGSAVSAAPRRRGRSRSASLLATACTRDEADRYAGERHAVDHARASLRIGDHRRARQPQSDVRPHSGDRRGRDALIFAPVLRYDRRGRLLPELARRGADLRQRRHLAATARRSCCACAAACAGPTARP